MHRKFISLADPAMTGYAFDSQAYAYDAPVCDKFRMFQTYGDTHPNGAVTQHSGDWPITREYLADYLASFVAFAINQPDQLTGQTENGYDENILGRLQSQLTSGVPHKDTLDFCASVIYKPAVDGTRDYTKRRYFSISERKISSHASKQHDKRYEEIRDNHDGSPNAIFAMLSKDYYHDLERYALADSIREWFHAQPDYSKSHHYIGLTAEFLKWFKDASSPRDSAQQLRKAYSAARALTEAYRLQCQASSDLDSYKQSIRKPVAAETAAPATEEPAA